MDTKTRGVEAAAQSYIRRRGRCPPPKFDEWVSYAEAHGAVMVEELFDRIYDDLRPFWGIPADEVQLSAQAWPARIILRSGNMTMSKHNTMTYPYPTLYAEMVAEIATLLPDFDMPHQRHGRDPTLCSLG